MRAEQYLSDNGSMKRGVRQCCAFSPDLLNLYGEKIFREQEEIEGLGVEGHNMSNLRQADDSTLISGCQQGLQDPLDKVVEESREKRRDQSQKDRRQVCGDQQENESSVHITHRER